MLVPVFVVCFLLVYSADAADSVCIMPADMLYIALCQDLHSDMISSVSHVQDSN